MKTITQEWFLEFVQVKTRQPSLMDALNLILTAIKGFDLTCSPIQIYEYMVH